MLQALRKNMTYIMLIVAVCFIGLMVLGGVQNIFRGKMSQLQSGEIGSINGQKIMADDFNRMVETEIESMKANQNKETLSEFELQAIRERAWNQIVQDILMRQEVERLKITASSAEIVQQLRNNPPEFIQNQEYFLTDGHFDYKKYLEALDDPNNTDSWIPLENYFRNSIPMQKLGSWLMSTIRVSDEEIKKAYELKNSRINAQYVAFIPYSFMVDTSEISPNAIKSYYQEHKKDYTAPEQRKIKYVTFDLSRPTSSDSSRLRLDAEDMISQLKDGADFSDMAVRNSEDPGSAPNGGDLGFFKRGDMTKPFEEAAFNANVGEIVGPVDTPFGLHIIRTTEKKRDTIKAQHILMKYKVTPETREKINDRAADFSMLFEKSHKADFEKLAAEEEYEIKETPLFNEGNFVPGIGMSMYLNHLAFRREAGFVSRPVTVENRIFIFKISQIEKEHIRPFDSVSSEIRQLLMREKQKEMAKAECDRFWEKTQSMDFAAAAAQDSLPVRETGLFTYESGIPQIGDSPLFKGTAFGLSAGDISKPIQTDRACYVIKVIDKIGVEENDFLNQKETAKAELMNTKLNMSYTAWMENLKSNAKIEDLRKDYF